MIASGNKGWFPCSNQCAKYFLEEICGFSGHVSDRQAFAGGGKSRPGGGRRNVDRGRQTLDPGLRRVDDFDTRGLGEVIEYPRPSPRFFATGFFLFCAAGLIKVKILLNLPGYLLSTRLPGGNLANIS